MTKDRVPIQIVERDAIPFAHLYMDVIGPLLPKAEYNYCLCLIDSNTRFPFAFPLRAVTAKAVCDCLLQVFSLVGVSSVITSDQGTCFTAELTQRFLTLFGCCRAVLVDGPSFPLLCVARTDLGLPMDAILVTIQGIER